MRTRCISMRFTMRAPPMRQCTGCLFTRPTPAPWQGYYGAGRGPVRHDPIRMALHGHPVRRAACTGDLSSGARCAAAAAPPRWPLCCGALTLCALRPHPAPSTPMLYFLFWPVRLACWASAASWHARASRAAPGRALRPLAKAFGYAAAVKWTGVFAGAGLAVLYFWALCKNKGPSGPAGTQAAVRGLWVRARWRAAVHCLFSFRLAFIWPVIFPLGLGTPQYTLADWWAAQQSMYAYHSALNATPV